MLDISSAFSEDGSYTGATVRAQAIGFAAKFYGFTTFSEEESCSGKAEIRCSRRTGAINIEVDAGFDNDINQHVLMDTSIGIEYQKAKTAQPTVNNADNQLFGKVSARYDVKHTEGWDWDAQLGVELPLPIPIQVGGEIGTSHSHGPRHWEISHRFCFECRCLRD